MNETVRATTIAEYRKASESFIVVSCRTAPEPEWGESEYQELLGPRAPPGRVPGVEQFATALGSILNMDRAISICLHLACVWPTTPCSEQRSCKVHTRSVRPLAISYTDAKSPSNHCVAAVMYGIRDELEGAVTVVANSFPFL